MPLIPNPIRLVLRSLMLLAVAAFFALHFVHLTADFPNFSPWMDWSKYTDEGWYGDAAIRHFQIGHWYVPGDFNPAAALPVWPLLEAAVFCFTGVSLVAARALTVCVFGAILVSSFFLLRRWATLRTSTLAAYAAILLLAVSPFCFVFTRLAILEPLLVLLTLIAMLTASNAVPCAPDPSSINSGRQNLLNAIRSNKFAIPVLGLLLPAIILTKTTGLFLFPAIAFLLFAALGNRIRQFFYVAIPIGVQAIILWFAYFVLIVRPHYLLDYRYLFSANGYTQITLATAPTVLASTFTDGAWMGKLLFATAVICIAISVISLKRLRNHPLIPALLLWALGYAAFLAYHDNLQPRYYLVVAVPLTLLIPVVFEELILARIAASTPRWLTFAAVAALILAIAIPQSHQTISYVRHPQYTLVDAFKEVHNIIAADHRNDPEHNPLVLSISGSDLSLVTGIPSICDDFGTLELTDRVKQYRPGWYLAWNKVEDDKMEALAPVYDVDRVAAYPAMDDPDRNLLILYRLNPSDGSQPNPHKHGPTPRNLRTKVGQQPSTRQLEH
jgi:hypothetical protein